MKTKIEYNSIKNLKETQENYFDLKRILMSVRRKQSLLRMSVLLQTALRDGADEVKIVSK
jgi:hypothetical protein